jgi:hypothetical protein
MRAYYIKYCKILSRVINDTTAYCTLTAKSDNQAKDKTKTKDKQKNKNKTWNAQKYSTRKLHLTEQIPSHERNVH